ncbi:CDP-glycerol glycerophosphotransferase family protein, partial [Clostridium perfringens]
LITEGIGKSNKLLSKKIIFLNHGWGTKMSPGKNELKSKISMDNYKLLVDTTDYIICNSDFDKTYFLKGIDGKEKIKYLPLGTPRNDYFFEINKEKIIEIKNQLGISKYKKIFLYCPTHREDKVLNENLVEKIINDFVEIDNNLKQENSLLIFRPHYFNSKLEQKVNGFSNILCLGINEYEDVRDLMIVSDCLISDYSSIFVDYLLINKPIIHYCFDIDEYEKNRGLVIDFSNEIQFPGYKINNLSDIFSLDISNNIEYYETKKIFYNNIGKCTDKILDLIFEVMEEI